MEDRLPVSNPKLKIRTSSAARHLSFNEKKYEEDGDTKDPKKRKTVGPQDPSTKPKAQTLLIGKKGEKEKKGVERERTFMKSGIIKKEEEVFVGGVYSLGVFYSDYDWEINDFVDSLGALANGYCPL